MVKPSTGGTAPVTTLTAREKTVLRALWRTKQIKAVAQQLDRSRSTVATQLESARAKLGTGTSMEAARLLAEHEQHRSNEPRSNWPIPDDGSAVHSEPVTDQPPVPVVRDIAVPSWPGEQSMTEWKKGRAGSAYRKAISTTIEQAIAAVVLIILLTFGLRLWQANVPWNFFDF